MQTLKPVKTWERNKHLKHSNSQGLFVSLFKRESKDKCDRCNVYGLAYAILSAFKFLKQQNKQMGKSDLA